MNRNAASPATSSVAGERDSRSGKIAPPQFWVAVADVYKKVPSIRQACLTTDGASGCDYEGHDDVEPNGSSSVSSPTGPVSLSDPDIHPSVESPPEAASPVVSPIQDDDTEISDRQAIAEAASARYSISPPSSPLSDTESLNEDDQTTNVEAESTAVEEDKTIDFEELTAAEDDETSDIKDCKKYARAKSHRQVGTSGPRSPIKLRDRSSKKRGLEEPGPSGSATKRRQPSKGSRGGQLGNQRDGKGKSSGGGKGDRVGGTRRVLRAGAVKTEPKRGGSRKRRN
ncbi:hypothetical protein V5O48_018251 [Marasmius crinis-equi]|uniref:Uncharacterized protein n=1 Tax=Marasmius crinis-equi TaxID=585013 RepID=A0ABR3ELQ4_9AGAR